jgi:hypothetical protein
MIISDITHVSAQYPKKNHISATLLIQNPSLRLLLRFRLYGLSPIMARVSWCRAGAFWRRSVSNDTLLLGVRQQIYRKNFC